MTKYFLYRIYCGGKIPDSETKISKNLLRKTLKKFKPIVKGWTIVEGEGHWNDIDEPSYIVELGLPNPFYAMEIALIYKLTYRQDSVMVVIPNNECIFV